MDDELTTAPAGVSGPPLGGGLLDRIGAGLFPARQPMESLLTEDDIRSAQRQGLLSLGAGLLAQSGPSVQPVGFGQAVGTALQGAQQQYHAALEGASALRLKHQQIQAQQREQAKASRLAQVRNEVTTRHPMPTGGDDGALRTWIDQVLPLFLEAGDDEAVARLSEIRKSIAEKAGRAPQLIDLGDKVVARDPATGQIVYEAPKGVAPRDTAAGAEQREEMSRQRAFSREQQLARQYESRTKDYAEIAAKATVVYASASNPSAAGDLSLIFAYMKLLDPGSVVREGEFATAANAGNIPQTIIGQYNKLLTGEGRLDPTLRADFVNRAKRLVQSSRARLRQVMKQYESRARNAGVDPSMVVYDYFEGMGDDVAAPGASATVVGQPGSDRVRQYLGGGR